MSMFRVQHIDSFEAPDLAPYRTMKMQHEHRVQRIFVAEGEKAVRRLLASNLTVLSVVLPEKWRWELDPLLKARTEDFTVYVAEKPLLETLTGYSMYQGLLAVARIPQSIELPSAVATTQRPRLFVAVDGLTNAQNMGGLVRNCAAFGVQALVVGETCASPYLRRAVRGSMGAIFQTPIVEPTDLASALRALQRYGVRCLAAHPHSDRKSLSDTDLSVDLCLVFGSEGYGLAPRVLEACQHSVAIPMQPHVDSLNVGSAVAVFLYEACRQRGQM
jgi:tRNA G18 (ribose-2'-O)-methylase SpoU